MLIELCSKIISSFISPAGNQLSCLSQEDAGSLDNQVNAFSAGKMEVKDARKIFDVAQVIPSPQST